MAASELLKSRVENLRDYELVVILTTDTPKEKVEAILEGISKTIAEKEGSFTEVNHWGKRKLAYLIGRYGEGYYVFIKMKAKPSSIRKISTDLRISEQVIRHMAINMDEE